MTTFIRDYVDGCAICQSTKTLPKTPVPLQPNQTPQGIWQTITMDFITDLPQSQGKDSLFVVVDCFSKATIITPCTKDITAEQTATLFLENVWRRTGLPDFVISDRGPQFASQVMTTTWKHLNVVPKLSTAYHP